MNRLKLLFAVMLCAATAAVAPAAYAQTVHYVGAGSSAMFQGFLVAAANDMPAAIGKAGTTFHHWSAKTSNVGCGGACGLVRDSRTAGIPDEKGNLWIVWSATGGAATDIWAYISTDSVVGVRAFLGGAKLVLNAAVVGAAPDNIASPFLLQAGAPGNGAGGTCPVAGQTTCDDTTLAADVITALGGAGGAGIAISAGMTDIRPEDAKYATNRALGGNVADTSATGVGCPGAVCRSWSLGYGPGPVATAGIKSGTGTSTAVATPVQFALPGFADPITSTTVPNTISTFGVGEAPIIFIVNRSNTAAGHLGQLAADGVYFARNVWDQHPFPPNGTPPAPTTRRPLGNLFTGHDCGTDNAAFTWPTDTGNRIPAGQPGGPIGGVVQGIHLFFREPLSGTMNTTEFTEFRIYGTTNGNGPTGNGQPALTSQEQNVDPNAAGGNPVKGLPCVAGAPVPVGGNRTRSIGTGELVNGVSGSGGILNTADSIGYTFFSFSNVANLGTKNVGGVLTKQPAYGYLMIDGIDPLFDNYQNAFGGAGQPLTANPGQPAISGTGTTYGEIPGCATDPANVLPDCTTLGIWGSNPSYPHLRDGKYPAWSELRMLCDTANAHCTAATDPGGAEALVQNLQFDIHSNKVGGVPDLLPFSDAGSGALSFNPPYGDAAFVREHFTFRLSQTGSALFTPPTSTHESNTQVVFQSETCSGGAAPGTPVTSPPNAECGGDAGGFIVPAGSTAVQKLQ
jgi:hypothetical protein